MAEPADKPGRSWSTTIRLQRNRIARLLRESPSLRPQLPEINADAYSDAILMAAEETRLDENLFPPQCPFTIEQILSEDLP